MASRKRAQRGQRGQADKEKPAECQAGSADKLRSQDAAGRSRVWFGGELREEPGLALEGEEGFLHSTHLSQSMSLAHCSTAHTQLQN